jgi:hypothetical protein
MQLGKKKLGQWEARRRVVELWERHLRKPMDASCLEWLPRTRETGLVSLGQWLASL